MSEAKQRSNWRRCRKPNQYQQQIDADRVKANMQGEAVPYDFAHLFPGM
ncbi:unnamed protein product, partial [Adineta steineri]